MRCTADSADDSKEEFMKASSKRMSTETLVMGALMTALVVVFQCVATYTTFFGPFSTAIGLIPIIIGAVMCGPLIGAWLGLIFGVVVLVTGGANLFLAFSVHGAIITVLVKGALCGFVSGLVNKLLKNVNRDVAAIAASVACPIVNTGIFLLGCVLFFMPYADSIAEAIAMDVTGMDLFLALATGNFLFELGMCIILSPIVVRILNIKRKK